MKQWANNNIKIISEKNLEFLYNTYLIFSVWDMRGI